MIPAHDSPLAALAFDASGTKLATASEKVNTVCLRQPVCEFRFPAKQILLLLPLQVLSHLCESFACSQGTVIRVFSIPEGQKLFEFRRGVKR